MAFTPRRSVLYMPGANTRALEKARGLEADVLILDLEDAVAPSQKTVAREQVLAAVNEGGYGYRELVVRVNGFDTPWGRDDIAAFAQAPIAALCLPKVESAAEVRAVAQLLKQHEAPAALKLWTMAEFCRLTRWRVPIHAWRRLYWARLIWRKTCVFLIPRHDWV